MIRCQGAHKPSGLVFLVLLFSLGIIFRFGALGCITVDGGFGGVCGTDERCSYEVCKWRDLIRSIHWHGVEDLLDDLFCAQISRMPSLMMQTPVLTPPQSSVDRSLAGALLCATELVETTFVGLDEVGVGGFGGSEEIRFRRGGGNLFAAFARRTSKGL